ncbi:MAG: hypothetical protein LBO20_01495, partial [Bifidobacteriaceae bacterium]|nr:hypothetical protein [Bifidobacteriaceae bacterium]
MADLAALGVDLAWRRRPLWARLALVFMVMLAALGSVAWLALASTWATDPGRALRVDTENALDTAVGQVREQFGKLSAAGADLSEQLSRQIEATLGRHGSAVAELAARPETLEDVLRDCLDALITALRQNQTSGAYLVLDATVDPGAEASSSRAGLFLRNTEPNAVNRTDLSANYLRGPMQLARDRGIPLLKSWQLEFDVVPGDFFNQALGQADPAYDITRAYWWNPAGTLSGDYETAMVLA